MSNNFITLPSNTRKSIGTIMLGEERGRSNKEGTNELKKEREKQTKTERMTYT
jgi:hypothetical protein